MKKLAWEDWEVGELSLIHMVMWSVYNQIAEKQEGDPRMCFIVWAVLEMDICGWNATMKARVEPGTSASENVGKDERQQKNEKFAPMSVSFPPPYSITCLCIKCWRHSGDGQTLLVLCWGLPSMGLLLRKIPGWSVQIKQMICVGMYSSPCFPCIRAAWR